MTGLFLNGATSMSIKRVLHKSRYFTLSKTNKPTPNKRGKGKRYYIITQNWLSVGSISIDDDNWIQKVLDESCKVSRHSWEYTDKTKAEKLYNMMLLRWA